MSVAQFPDEPREPGDQREDTRDPDAQAPSGAATADSLGKDFDLRDLAGMQVWGDDIFSGLGIAGLGATATDPLADLLNPPPTIKRTARHSPEPRADAATQPESRSGILAELHAEFLRVMHDPSHLPVQTVWQTGDKSVGKAPLTLAQWQRRAEVYSSLNELMLPRLSIDALIEEFAPLNSAMLLDPEKHVDVLHLFAGDLLRDRPQAIPSLTRAEHHATSLDSHFRIGNLHTKHKESS